MERRIAEEIAKIASDCSRQADESTKEVMDSCSVEVFQQYRRLAGRVMGYIFTDVLAPIWTEHGEIAPDWFRDRDKDATSVSRPVIDCALRDRLLALTGELSRNMKQAIALAESSHEQGQASQMREAIAEILKHVDNLSHYINSLDVSSEHDSNKM